MDLLESQKEEIFKILVENGIDPNRFEWKLEHPEFMIGIPVLSYKQSRYYFAFNIENEDPYGENYNLFSPGDQSLVDRSSQYDWKSQVGNFKYWLRFLQRETNAKNPWEHISDYIPGREIYFEENNVNEKFSPPEVQKIEESLNKFKSVLLERYDLTADQLEIVNQKIDYLCDSAKRSTKIDWKNILVGTIIQLFINIGMTTQQVQNLWQYLYACFVKLLSS